MKILHLSPLLVLTGFVAAQSIRPLPARGMMTAQSAGLVFENEPSAVVRKGPGLPAFLDPIQAGIVAGVPDYSTKAIGRFLEASLGYAIDVHVDAMSTGNDLLPVVRMPGTENSFRVAVPPQGSGWATLSLVRKVTGQSVGADILGYYFDNPLFPSQLRNAVVHEAVRADYLADGFDPAGSDIAAIDYAMGQILASHGREEAGVIESVKQLFFSVTPACAQALDATGFFPSLVDAATIFCATYDEQSGEVSELKIQDRPVGPVDLDVDALGVAKILAPAQALIPGSVQLEAGSMMFLLSFAQGAHGNEELVVWAAPDTTTGVDPMVMRPLRWTNGAPMIGTSSIPGIVTGICTRDPDQNIGARSFGVPHVDAVGSVPVFSLEVQNPTTQQPSDVFSITGVVAGASYPGASAWLGVWHGPSFQFYDLGTWTGGQAQFSLQFELKYPWVPDVVGGVPGPNLTCTNIYEMMVVFMPPGLMGPPLGVSTTCVLRRRDYD